MNRGTGWATNAGAGYRYWQDVGISADGSVIFAVANSTDGAGCVSTDEGNSWATPGTLPTNCYRCAVSPDGQYLTAWGPSITQLYVSTDGGTSFAVDGPTAFTGGCRSLAIVGNGLRQYGVGTDSFVYYTTDAWDTFAATSALPGGIGMRRVVASDDGTTIVVVQQGGTAGAYISTDSGSNWDAITDGVNPLEDIYDVAISSDGTYITLAQGGAAYALGYLWVSTDGGSNFTSKGANDYWTSVAMSASGQYQTANMYGSSADTYTSDDYGATWTGQTFAPAGQQAVVRVSRSGALIQVILNDYLTKHYIRMSTQGVVTLTETETASDSNERCNLTNSFTETGVGSDVIAWSPRVMSITEGPYNYAGDILQTGRNPRFGTNWYKSPHTTPAGIKVCAVSGDTGQYQVVAADGTGPIYYSDNKGLTWSELTAAGSRAWTGLAISGDGTYITAIVDSGYIYTSDDSGSSFTARTGAGVKSWTCVSMSNSGQYQTATIIDVTPYGIWYSQDYGVNWSPASIGFAMAVKVAANDGTVQFCTTAANYVYRSINGGANWSNASGIGYCQHYLSCSGDGGKAGALVGVSYNDYGFLRLSPTGTSWTPNISLLAAQGEADLSDYRYHRGFAISADASRYVAVCLSLDELSTEVYVSLNQGLTWRLMQTLPFAAPSQTQFAYSDDLGYMMIPDGE